MKYEYRYVQGDSIEELTEKLNSAGRDGWKCVSVIRQEIMMRYQAVLIKGAAMKKLSAEAINWLAFGERGLSSESIIGYLLEVPGMTDCINLTSPSDPDDFRRCQLLLEQVPELKPLFPKMAEVSKYWAALVKHWPELIKCMDEDYKDWRDKHAKFFAHKTWDKMQEIFKGLEC